MEADEVEVLSETFCPTCKRLIGQVTKTKRSDGTGSLDSWRFGWCPNCVGFKVEINEPS